MKASTLLPWLKGVLQMICCFWRLRKFFDEAWKRCRRFPKPLCHSRAWRHPQAKPNGSGQASSRCFGHHGGVHCAGRRIGKASLKNKPKQQPTNHAHEPSGGTPRKRFLNNGLLHAEASSASTSKNSLQRCLNRGLCSKSNWTIPNKLEPWRRNNSKPQTLEWASFRRKGTSILDKIKKKVFEDKRKILKASTQASWCSNKKARNNKVPKAQSKKPRNSLILPQEKSFLRSKKKAWFHLSEGVVPTTLWIWPPSVGALWLRSKKKQKHPTSGALFKAVPVLKKPPPGFECFLHGAQLFFLRLENQGLVGLLFQHPLRKNWPAGYRWCSNKIGRKNWGHVLK